MAYRVMGTQQPYNSISKPPQQHRQASFYGGGTTNSPNQQQSFTGYQPYSSTAGPSQGPPPPQQYQGYGSASMSGPSSGLTSSGGASSWNMPGQQSTGTPQSTAPKAFSWGLPIAGHTPKAAADEAHHGSPESPRLTHGTPSHTPQRHPSSLYPSFDADDEGPPRESSLGMEEDYGYSSPHPVQSPLTRPQPSTSNGNANTESAPTYAIVVFGFPPSAQQAVQSAFTSLGDVASVTPPPHNGANWLTIAYRSKWDAANATRRSGDVIAGSMIGVKWADPAQSDTPAQPPTSSSAATSTSTALTTVNASAPPQPRDTRPPPAVGERVAVLSAAEALKRPSSTPASPAQGVRALFGGAGAPMASQGQPPASPHANLFKGGQPAAAKQGGLSRWVSDLVFGE